MQAVAQRYLRPTNRSIYTIVAGAGAKETK
jgi:hypothetical protein